MNEKMSFIFGLAIASMFWVFLNILENEPKTSAISECEKSLPRDQHCEIIITAKIKKEK